MLESRKGPLEQYAMPPVIVPSSPVLTQPVRAPAC
jgi:hypothetical protein